MPRRALVTGGTGFVGSHLVQALLAADWEVHLLLRPSPEVEPRPSLQNLTTCVQMHTYSGDTSEVVRAMVRSQPDVVFHVASLFLAQHTPEQVLPLVESNVLLGTQLLEAMRVAGVHSLVNTGSCWQYLKRESYSPVNLYAATKQAFEDILAYFVDATGMRAITLSLFDTYGRRDLRRKLLSLLLDCLEKDVALEMSPGQQVIDLLHIEDLCAAFLHAAELVSKPEHAGSTTYAVSGGQRRTVREIVALLEQAAGRQLPVLWGARPYRQREVMVPWIGTPLPGWTPKIGLLEGFRDLLEERSMLPSSCSPRVWSALTPLVDGNAGQELGRVAR